MRVLTSVPLADVFFVYARKMMMQNTGFGAPSGGTGTIGGLQGSRISLISKSEIRYEGFLYSINPDENTVALRNVRMFGTEGKLHPNLAAPGSDPKQTTVLHLCTPRGLHSTGVSTG